MSQLNGESCNRFKDMLSVNKQTQAEGEWIKNVQMDVRGRENKLKGSTG